MKKPIVFFNLATTGKTTNLDNVRIIEISAKKIDPDTNQEIEEPLYYRCSNGDKPIQQEAIDIHGITEDMICDCPTFNEIAGEVFSYFEGCDVGGYCCTIFDIPVLYYSFIRAGYTWNYKELDIYDVYTAYRKFNSGKLSDVYTKYTGKVLNDQPTSEQENNATLEIFMEMYSKDEVLDSDELSVLKCNLDTNGHFKIRTTDTGNLDIYIDFGKHKGKSVSDIESSYFKWIMENIEFPPDTRFYAKRIYNSKTK